MPISVIVSDLDCTVADTRHRAHLAALGSPIHEDWIEYSKACRDDTPIQGVVSILQLLGKTHPIFFVSGRNAEAGHETAEWLLEHGLRFSGLRLRSADDISDNAKYKAAYIKELQRGGLEVAVMLEDNAHVAKVVQDETGVPVLQVHPGFEDTIGVRIATDE